MVNNNCWILYMVDIGLNIQHLSTIYQHFIRKTYNSIQFIQIRNKFLPTNLFFLLNAILHDKVQSLFLPCCQFCRVLNQKQWQYAAAMFPAVHTSLQFFVLRDTNGFDYFLAE